MFRYQEHLRALGSDVYLTLVTDEPQHFADHLFGILRSTITTFEAQFSRFLPDSELTRFNEQAGKSVTVTPGFLQLLSAAKKLASQTGGLYNPFILPALQSAGYLKSWHAATDKRAEVSFEGRSVASPQQLTIGGTWAQIPENAALDFGGIGKGYLLDQLSNLMRSERLNGYCLSLGGDIITEGEDLHGASWGVGVQDATSERDTVGVIQNLTGEVLAIATSGVTKRRGTKDGKEWHHIIDPQTGEPARTDILTATVSAHNATCADVFAKCIVIGGTRIAEQFKIAGYIQSFVVQSRNASIIKSADL